jgi:dihydroorotate dehydrogenase
MQPSRTKVKVFDASPANGFLSSQLSMYKVLRNILFLFPAEWVHYFSMNCLRSLCSIDFLKKLLATTFTPQTNSHLQSDIFNLKFENPVGLGAGFDKNAKYLRELEALGFGFVEIGTVTPLPQAGNDKPRLFRLPKDKALINRMGFNNDGVKIIAERLRQWAMVNGQYTNSNSPLPIHHSRLIIGGNIGKNKVTPNEDAWKDYEICFKELHHYVDYFVVNVSSPNTPGLRELQEKESLRKILRHLQMINNGKAVAKPILLKISPDLTKEQLEDVIDLAMEIKLDGLVATNTTIDRDGLNHDFKTGTRETGGLSGKPLQKRSAEIVRYIFEKTNGEMPIIASGGIFTGADAKEKLDAGASLVQVWTGFIYEGPSIVKKICEHLSTINDH